MVNLSPCDEEKGTYAFSMPNDNVTGGRRRIYYFIRTGSSKEWEIPIIKGKIRCYFMAFVLFILIYKGILPIHKKDILMDEVPFGFG